MSTHTKSPVDLKNVFESFYILPSLFDTDRKRFCVAGARHSDLHAWQTAGVVSRLVCREERSRCVGTRGIRGHQEINRTNLISADIDAGLQQHVVQAQLELLRFRAQCKAFGFDATLEVLPAAPHELKLRWSKDGATATLEIYLRTYTYRITEG